MTKDKEKEKAIATSMEKLGISREEAEELWLFDHDELECEEVEVLEKKMEKPKKSGSPLDKVRDMKAKKKKDKEKESIISAVFDFVRNSPLVFAPQDMTSTKLSFMDSLGGYYSITITKHKKQPDGYNGKGD